MGKCLTTSSLGPKTKTQTNPTPELLHLPKINSPTMVNFKLPMWLHRMWTCEEIQTKRCPCELVQAGSDILLLLNKYFWSGAWHSVWQKAGALYVCRYFLVLWLQGGWPFPAIGLLCCDTAHHLMSHVCGRTEAVLINANAVLLVPRCCQYPLNAFLLSGNHS